MHDATQHALLSVGLAALGLGLSAVGLARVRQEARAGEWRVALQVFLYAVLGGLVVFATGVNLFGQP